MSLYKTHPTLVKPKLIGIFNEDLYRACIITWGPLIKPFSIKDPSVNKLNNETVHNILGMKACIV